MNARPLPPVWRPINPRDQATTEEHATIVRLDIRLHDLEVNITEGVAHQERTGYATAVIIIARCTNTTIAVIRRLSGETIILEQVPA